jgi:hypothetical protein
VVRALGYLGCGAKAEQLGPIVGASWRAELQAWTEMRHGLVHRAETPYVRRAQAEDCVRLIDRLVRAIDHLVLGDD